MQICFHQAADTAMIPIASSFLKRAGTHMIADRHDVMPVYRNHLEGVLGN